MEDLSFFESYGIVAAALITVAVLLVMRQKLRTSPAVETTPENSELLYIPDIIETNKIGNAQTIGKREEQDDYFSSSTTKIGTMAVIADGISGLSHGRMASTLAVTVFSREYLKVDDPADIPEYFHKAALISNRAILEQLGGETGGTTLVVGIVSGGLLHWAAVGDSMIILFRDGEFIPINSKHTLETVLEEKYLSGEISKEEAKENPNRDQLVNYLGYGGFKSMEVGDPVSLQAKDTIILCSDGVYDALTEVEMEQILMRGLPPQDAAEEMISLIERKSYKHQDNATVIILQMD
ncbi:PP2C family serine/threonine-protein phosphatase [Paenibacillus lautus]|uniref:PP2C family protein-serine/threonine phosphatase n=1 Tax=Paenibacillus lautus TaxID=1401 RepID=UPI003D29EF93